MSARSSVSSNNTRLRGLDALRGMAALAIVLYHATDRSAQSLPQNLFYYPARIIHFAVSQTYISVFLFFVISGFCIHLQWARARAAGEQKPKIPFGSFWKRRFRRLYPPYAIALALYLLLTAATVGLDVTRFVVYDVVMHLFMLHNLDAHTSYSINGIFWTLAIEEQLYLAYFLLLFIRVRWGWATTLIVCLMARVGWMVLSHLVWLKTGFGLPVPESAAAHWFTWALGAIGVEAMFGLVKLPRWSRDLRLATVVITIASVISAYLPVIPKDTPIHDISWFLIHPLWGVGFFMVVNRIVVTEQGWVRELRLPSLISIFATLGIFSYSIYLTHELVIMQSWRWIYPSQTQLVNVALVIVPATIVFAWVFFWFCERPFMVRRDVTTTAAEKEQISFTFKLGKEGFASRAFFTTLRTRFDRRLRHGSHTSEPNTEPAASSVGPAARLANTYADSIAVADSQN
ncbi:MAG TPA: acyltransferase [Pyrinomonadaceae bacterium]|nr:acyltransferase [Pyrinomonadaceae bacterium]